MGDIIPVLHADFRKQKKKRTLQFRLIPDYSHFHIFLYQNCLSLQGNDALSEDNAYDNVLSEKRKMQNYLPLPPETHVVARNIHR